MQVIPLQPVPAQVLNIVLGGQNCTIRIYQTVGGLFCDLYVGSVLIIGGVLCQNGNVIVRDAYLDFIGDIGFLDNSGLGMDPDYTGLGDGDARYTFVYLEPIDLNGAA